MPASDFTFISPGIFTNEIDQSQFGQGPTAVGPVVIGRFQKGPGMTPTKVNNYEDFVKLFGLPGDGSGENDWREGNHSAVDYGGWAAKTWLQNNSPITIVRVVGDQSSAQTSATDGTLAGWKTDFLSGSLETFAQNGGAFGLFMIPSASNHASVQDFVELTGTLAAVWYLNEGGIALSGTALSAACGIESSAKPFLTASTSALIKNTTAGGEFTIILNSGSADTTEEEEKYTFNFDPGSNKFVRNVFNTDPTKINKTITDYHKSYWLGETFENHITGTIGTDDYFGIILSLASGSGAYYADFFGKTSQSAQSGWIISNDSRGAANFANFNPARDTLKLFKFHSLTGDAWVQKNIKISIVNISGPVNKEADPYGRFGVEVRELFDDDKTPKVLEFFDNVSLDAASPRFIAKVVGDQYLTWDDTAKRFRRQGTYANKSAYVRVEMAQNSYNPSLLPFGFEGPARPLPFSISSGSAGTKFAGAPSFDGTTWGGALGFNSLISGGLVVHNAYEPVPTTAVGAAPAAGSGWESRVVDHIYALIPDKTVSFKWPDIELVQSASDVGFTAESAEAAKDCYFGFKTSYSTGKKADKATIDILRAMPDGITDFSTGDRLNGLGIQTFFTLDDISGTAPPVYVSGSRAANTSLTAVNTDFEAPLDQDIDKFSLPLYGGFDGLDILEPDPFNNSDLSGKTERNHYGVYSLGKAIDIVANKEDVEYNLALVPGVTNTTVTDKLLDKVTARGDALALVDLEGGWKPKTETRDRTASATRGSVSTTISNLKTRAINNSYGCAYYPWVQARTSDGNSFYLPPSVAALGAMSYTENVTNVWFAPAGFNRGGLDGAVSKYGINITDTVDVLNARDRDKLYEVNINPIAKFVSEGIVIFGQKTLQVKKSALDRINVRRLLIYLKRNISFEAKDILFEQNVQTTWTKFKAKVNPFLAGVKAGGGIVDYKLILDETTTTPDLVDQNALYAKIIVKPAKSIEFVLLDFVITNQGAAFND